MLFYKLIGGTRIRLLASGLNGIELLGVKIVKRDLVTRLGQCSNGDGSHCVAEAVWIRTCDDNEGEHVWGLTFDMRAAHGLPGDILSIEGLGAALCTIELQHVAEECPLFNGIVQRHVCVGKFIEPLLWHVAFGAFSIFGL
jgi:hypothetical protein